MVSKVIFTANGIRLTSLLSIALPIGFPVTEEGLEPGASASRAAPDHSFTARPGNSRRLTRPDWADVAAIFGLMCLLLQLFLCSRLMSATYDEQYHIANGLTFLRTGDLGLIPEHPPLINLISALPLLADHSLTLPPDLPSSQRLSGLTYSDLFLWRLNPDGPSIVARARVPVMVLTLFLAVTVYAWGRELYGPRAALLALTLLAFDPNVLAHGCLATNDMGLTCFATMALYAFWRWLRQPSPGRAVFAGLTLGLAQVSKFSALFLLPAIAIIALADAGLNHVGGIKKQTTGRIVWHLLIVVLAASFALWAVYGFQMGTLKGYPFPARAHLTGLQAFTNMIDGGKNSFLLGSYSDTGWWYYFPVAFAVKTPLPTILLIAYSLFYAYRRRTLRLGLPLLIPAVIYFGACLASPFNIGYRHLLPLLPLLFIFAGQLACLMGGAKQIMTWVLGTAVAWLIIGVLLTFPHYLAFFNEVVGGRDRRYRVLVDSNLDWGQGLIGMREYLNREKIVSVKLSYLGTADPAAYGITYEPLPSFPYHQWQSESLPEILVNPPSGVYAISATNLQGLPFKNHDLFAAFRDRKPDAIIGHSIFIYRVH